MRTEAAHRVAYVTITRAQLEFPQILSAYDAAAAPGDPVCQIAFPVSNSSHG